MRPTPRPEVYDAYWYLAAERPSLRSLAGAAAKRIPSFALAIFTALLLIWAGYRFSFGKAGGILLPAPQLFTDPGSTNRP